MEQSWRGQTVLVVDDSVPQRNYLCGLLAQLGFGAVLQAGNGLEALQLLEGGAPHRPFLVLTDLEMPGMDGIELTSQLALRNLARHLIVCSAQDPRLLEVVESMASEDSTLNLLGTLLKPVRPEALLELLAQAAPPAAAHGAARPPAAPPAWQPSVDELAQALGQGQFLPYFQPRVSMRNGRLKGVEALARWQHPQHGLLPPAYFIPALEGSPLMAGFTLDIVRQVLDWLKAWHGSGMPALVCSVNLSADNLCDRSFIERLQALVAGSGVAPRSLVWEVTETMLMRQLSQSLANLGRLRLMGFGLAMDDFGIGYSSMQQFARCPFSELKIDRAFVHGASRWPNRHVVLRSAIELGQRLGVATVAEGVETEADWQLLRGLGCEMAQGYLLARPMEGALLAAWALRERPRLKALAEDKTAAGGEHSFI